MHWTLVYAKFEFHITITTHQTEILRRSGSTKTANNFQIEEKKEGNGKERKGKKKPWEPL